jgi:hypothetical protein
VPSSIIIQALAVMAEQEPQEILDIREGLEAAGASAAESIITIRGR